MSWREEKARVLGGLPDRHESTLECTSKFSGNQAQVDIPHQAACAQENNPLLDPHPHGTHEIGNGPDLVRVPDDDPHVDLQVGHDLRVGLAFHDAHQDQKQGRVEQGAEGDAIEEPLQERVAVVAYHVFLPPQSRIPVPMMHVIVELLLERDSKTQLDIPGRRRIIASPPFQAASIPIGRLPSGEVLFEPDLPPVVDGGGDDGQDGKVEEERAI